MSAPEGMQKKEAAVAPRGRTGAGAKVVAIAIVLGLAIGGAAGYLLFFSGGKARETLVIALQPTSSPDAISAKATELEQFLESRLPDVDVKIFIPLDTSAVIASLQSGQSHVALMGSWPATLANRAAGAEIALAEKREVIIGTEKKEETYYFSYFVGLNAGGYASLNDTAGKRACFTSKTSSSGYLFPLATLVKTGKIPRPAAGETADASKFFGEVKWAGNYQACWESVKQGSADVGVIAGDVAESLYNEVLASTTVLETNGPVPSHAVVFAKELGEPLRTKVRTALLELGKPEHRDLMRKLVSSIFVEFVVTTTAAHTSGLDEALDLTNL
jgi:phosphonate transport system substrate-binding protein